MNEDLAKWAQKGRTCLWRYVRAPGKYADWHCSADRTGCDDVAGLAGLLAKDSSPAHRTLSLIDPTLVGADRIFGAHDLRVHHAEKLRIRNRPAGETAATLSWVDGVITMTLGRESLEELARAMRDVGPAQADFAIGFGEKSSTASSRISFWGWPRSAVSS